MIGRCEGVGELRCGKWEFLLCDVFAVPALSALLLFFRWLRCLANTSIRVRKRRELKSWRGYWVAGAGAQVA